MYNQCQTHRAFLKDAYRARAWLTGSHHHLAPPCLLGNRYGQSSLRACFLFKVGRSYHFACRGNAVESFVHVTQNMLYSLKSTNQMAKSVFTLQSCPPWLPLLCLSSSRFLLLLCSHQPINLDLSAVLVEDIPCKIQSSFLSVMLAVLHDDD